MKPPLRKPPKKYQSLEERFLEYALGGSQRTRKVITEAKGSGQFESMIRKINQGK